MLLRLASRFAVLLVSMAVASLIVFAVMAVLPGDPARVALGLNASEESVAQMRKEFGLDRPWPVRYTEWVTGLLTLDLGQSYVSGAEIAPQLVDRFSVTLWLVGTAMALAVLAAVPLGAVMALRHRSTVGVVLSAVSQVGMAVPAFLAGILLIALFAVRLGWLPSGGWTPPIEGAGEFLRKLVLPAVALALVQAAILARYVRNAVLEVMETDFIRTARAKGLTRRRALARHGWRNAAVPVVTVLGLSLTSMLVGAVVIERVFVIPGVGSLLVDAVGQRDLILVQDVVMVLVALVLVVNFLVDVLAVLIDPRVESR
ncbi:ABC transporter permease [Kytococcus sedentarius]|uniref:ABC transporter permease n=1 Tax=Kytococcus sedentarius TaxID=1276 RepID=UPI00384E0FCB